MAIKISEFTQLGQGGAILTHPIDEAPLSYGQWVGVWRRKRVKP